VGGQHFLTSDVRIISATHRELWEAVKEGDFREDLYYRLNVVSLRIPPLRERREDIPILAQHFLKVFAQEEDAEPKSLSDGAMSVLLRHVWPGNVRELLNTLKRASVLASERVIHTSDLGLSMEGIEKETDETFDDFLRRWLQEIVAPWSTGRQGAGDQQEHAEGALAQV
jgi:DNA-binding NtrC family response regulator